MTPNRRCGAGARMPGPMYAARMASTDPRLIPLLDTSKRPEPKVLPHPLGGERYTSRDFMEREWERVWTRVWQIGCLESELTETGDFVTHEIGRESLIFARHTNGEIRGFYNVCQHRGNRLVPEERGRSGAFVCPYHGWVWQTDGELRKVQDEEDFPESPCGRLSLTPVRVETWAGFVWFNLDPDAGPLMEFLDPVARQMDTYRMQDMVRTGYTTVEVDCNWKVIQDNFSESYHIPTVHPGLKYFLDDTYQSTQFDLYERGHTRMIMVGGGPSERAHGNEELILRGLREELEGWGLDPESFRGRLGDMRAELQRQKRKLSGERGYDFSHYVDEQLTDHLHYTVFPNLAFSMKPEGCIFLRPNPHPTDPEKCLFDCWYFTLFPEGDDTSRVQQTDGVWSTSREPAAHSKGLLGEVPLGAGISEDASVFISQQQGLRSRAFGGATLAGQERRIAYYHQVIDEYLDGSRG